MKYIVCEKPGQFRLLEKEGPIRKENEALLQVKKVGICGTDLHAYGGRQAFFTYPRILGHELSTRVVEVPDNDLGIKAGDKVVIMPYIYCGDCIACKKGKTNCCAQLRVIGVHSDGGMQERITVPMELLIPSPELRDEQMAIVEPLAIGAHALRRASIRPGEDIVVVGCGPIGIGIIKLAQAEGARVIAIDMNRHRLDYARNKLGVNSTVLGGEKAVEEVSELTGGQMATAVFDATGNKEALQAGISYMSHGGRYVLVGLSLGELNFSHPDIHAKEASILCSRNATREDFEYVIKKLDHFPTDAFITHSVPYTEMIHHFDSWLDPATKVMKATVDF